MKRFVPILCAATAVLFSRPAVAQTGNASDITGINTTGSTIAGGAFVPGFAMGAAVPSNVVNAISVNASVAAGQLAAGTLRSPFTGALIAPGAQRIVASVMGTGDPAARAALRAALAQSGARPSVVNALVAALPGLLSNPTGAQVQRALVAFNAFVQGASAEFLANPPAEFQAVHAVLQAYAASASAPQN